MNDALIMASWYELVTEALHDFHMTDSPEQLKRSHVTLVTWIDCTLNLLIVCSLRIYCIVSSRPSLSIIRMHLRVGIVQFSPKVWVYLLTDGLILVPHADWEILILEKIGQVHANIAKARTLCKTFVSAINVGFDKRRTYSVQDSATISWPAMFSRDGIYRCVASGTRSVLVYQDVLIFTRICLR